jgi:glycine/D-amino acid oxidase-like deaminating enzyme
MYRRELLKGLAAAGASVALSSCAPKKIRATIPGVNCLPRVQVSPDRVTRTICGLRPYRPSGFVVRAEKIGDALIVHNYGHGGAGITLSWGTAKLAVDLGAPGHVGPVAVVGCGVVGLSTARLLQDAGFAVTIYAKDLPPNTTSNVAGGWWFPVTLSEPPFHTPVFEDQLLKAAKFAFERYQIMMGWRYGVRWTRTYFLNNSGFNETGFYGQQSILRSMMPEFRDLAEGEHPFPGYKHVRQFDAMLIEPPIYLAALTQDFRIAGGTIEVREFHTAGDLASLPQKLVFNCTGLGAKALFNDAELIPVKGQLTFLLPQPEIEYSAIPQGLYMFSRRDGILLGGTHERGNWSLDIDEKVKDEIVAGHQKFFSSMRGC